MQTCGMGDRSLSIAVVAEPAAGLNWGASAGASIEPFEVVSATQKSWRGLGSKAAPWPAPRAITAATTSSNGLAMIVGLILMG